MVRYIVHAVAPLAVLLWTSFVFAGAEVTVNGDTVAIDVSLPGGYGADVTLAFDDAVGLSASNLNVSAEVVDTQDVMLLSRLPGAGSVAIPASLPVKLTIAPPGSSGLAFDNAYTIEIHTENLHYVNGTPLRLFKSDDGGRFYDITEHMGAGSYRAGGRSGGFSEFLLLTDLRLMDQVISRKFVRLDQYFNAHKSSVEAGLRQDLQDDLLAGKTAFRAGAYAAARDAIESFLSRVETAVPGAMPSTWQASGSTPNVAGELVGRSATLAFSLDLAAP